MIHLITPLYRYNNIKIIYSTIINQISDFKWHLIEGDNHIGEESLDFLEHDDRVNRCKIKTYHQWGHEQRNYFITDIAGNDNDWCYFLDDDNVLTHDLVETIKEFEEYDIILLSQKKGLTEQTRLYGFEGHLKLGLSDIGSFVIKYGAIKNTLIPGIDQRNSDGHYAEQISQIDNIKIKYCPDKYTRYNSLSLEIS
jgi:hypothetical protein